MGLLGTGVIGSWLIPPGKAPVQGRGRWERIGEDHLLEGFEGGLVKQQKTQSAAAEGLQQYPDSSCTGKGK